MESGLCWEDLEEMVIEGDCDSHFGLNNPNSAPHPSLSCFIEGNYICQFGSISSLTAARELSAFHWQPNLTHSDQYRKAVLLFHYVPFVERDKRERAG